MKLFYREFGQGEPFFILHGLFGMSDNWVTLGRHFARYFHVYLLDLRNHGRSPHADAFNYEVMVDDIMEFVRDHQLERVHLLGHSMGGKVGMLFALEYAQYVKDLIVVDIAPRAYRHSHFRQFLKLLLNMDLSKLRSRIESDRYLAAKIPQTPIRQFLLKNLRRNEQNGFEWKINLPALYQNVDRILAGIHSEKTFPGPVLFLKGEKSDYIGQNDILQIKKLFPKARIVTVPSASHWVHAEAPDFLLNSVLEFASKKSGVTE